MSTCLSVINPSLVTRESVLSVVPLTGTVSLPSAAAEGCLSDDFRTIVECWLNRWIRDVLEFGIAGPREAARSSDPS